MFSPLRTRNFSSKFLLQFPLPLKSEVSRTNDHDTFGKSVEFSFANEKARHDRLASASVICEKEPNPRQLQKVIVNGLKLMGEGSTREMERPKYGSTRRQCRGNKLEVLVRGDCRRRRT